MGALIGHRKIRHVELREGEGDAAAQRVVAEVKERLVGGREEKSRGGRERRGSSLRSSRESAPIRVRVFMRCSSSASANPRRGVRLFITATESRRNIAKENKSFKKTLSKIWTRQI